MAKKKESSLNLIIKIVVLVGLMVAVVGIIANVVGDVNDTIDGFGGGTVSTKKPVVTDTSVSTSECLHLYEDGVCSECGTVCVHTESDTDENGSFYCLECNVMLAGSVTYNKNGFCTLKASSYVVKMGADYSGKFVPDDGYVLPETISVLMGNAILTEDDRYTYDNVTGEFTVKNVIGELYFTCIATTKDSAAKYYNVTYNENDHCSFEVDVYTVQEGKSYINKIIPDSGYALPNEIYITMGGVTLTSGYTYDNTTGAFVVENVTGDLYITYDATTGVPGVPVLTLNGSVVSWEAVPGATDYHVRVLGKNTTDLFDKYYEITATSFDLFYVEFTESATYTVSVWADNEYGFGEAAAIEYVYTEAPSDLLTAPEISFSSEGVIVWEAVPGANFYTIYVKGSEAEGSMRITSECRFDLTTYADELTEFGNVPYTIYIKASGEGYADSAASNNLTYNPSGEMLKLATPVIELV